MEPNNKIVLMEFSYETSLKRIECDKQQRWAFSKYHALTMQIVAGTDLELKQAP